MSLHSNVKLLSRDTYSYDLIWSIYNQQNYPLIGGWSIIYLKAHNLLRFSLEWSQAEIYLKYDKTFAVPVTIAVYKNYPKAGEAILAFYQSGNWEVLFWVVFLWSCIVAVRGQ